MILGLGVDSLIWRKEEEEESLFSLCHWSCSHDFSHWARPTQNGTIQMLLYHGFDKTLFYVLLNIYQTSIYRELMVFNGLTLNMVLFQKWDRIFIYVSRLHSTSESIFFCKNASHEWNKIHIQRQKIEFSVYYIFFGFWICFKKNHRHSAIHIAWYLPFWYFHSVENKACEDTI